MRPTLPQRARAAALVLWPALITTALAQPAVYRLDPTHSSVQFEVLHFGTSTLRGRVAMIQGDVELDAAARRGRAQAVVDMARLDTGVAPLDALLRGPEGFDVAAHPQAFFVATQFSFDAAGQVIGARGELTLHGASQPLQLTVQRFACRFNPLFRREVCGGDFVAELDRSAFGLKHSIPFVSDRVTLRIAVEAIRREAGD